MAHTSEYEIEDIFIDRLEGIGYKFIKLNNYDEVLANFREQLAKFNAKKLEEKGHTASFSDSEFNRIMIHVDNHSVYESAKVLIRRFIIAFRSMAKTLAVLKTFTEFDWKKLEKVLDIILSKVNYQQQ